MNLPFLTKTIGLLLSLVIANQAILMPLAEASIWEDRRAARQKHKERGPIPLYASIPLPTLNQSYFDINKRAESRTSNLTLPTGLKSISNAIPLSNVHVHEVHFPNKTDKPVVILIQDVHLHSEAQKNIAASLLSLIRHGNVNTIAMEGAFGPFDFSRFRAFPDKKIIKHVASTLLDANKIGAPSFVGITAQSAIPEFLGIDDKKHYDLNVQAYKKSKDLKENVQNRIEKLRFDFNQRKRTRLSPELQTFDNNWRAYHNGTLGLGAYLTNLSNHVNPKDSSIQLFLSACQLEDSLDFSRIENEQKDVFKSLAGQMNENELSHILNRSLAYKTGKIPTHQFFNELKQLIEKSGMSLNKFPHFKKYVDYALLADRINPSQLFPAIKRMEERVLYSLSPTHEEKALIYSGHTIELIDKLIEFELTPIEWNEYKKKRAFSLFKNDELNSFENFYKEADIRSDAMAHNLMSLPREGNRALILGGFHTSHVTRLLKNEDWPYVVLTPKISKVEEEGGAGYLSVFDQEKTPLDRLFAGEKLFIYPNRIAAGYWSRATRTINILLLVALSVFTLQAGLPLPEITGVVGQIVGNNVFQLTLGAIVGGLVIHVGLKNKTPRGYKHISNDPIFGFSFLKPKRSSLSQFKPFSPREHLFYTITFGHLSLISYSILTNLQFDSILTTLWIPTPFLMSFLLVYLLMVTISTGTMAWLAWEILSSNKEFEANANTENDPAVIKQIEDWANEHSVSINLTTEPDGDKLAASNPDTKTIIFKKIILVKSDSSLFNTFRKILLPLILIHETARLNKINTHPLFFQKPLHVLNVFIKKYYADLFKRLTSTLNQWKKNKWVSWISAASFFVFPYGLFFLPGLLLLIIIVHLLSSYFLILNVILFGLIQLAWKILSKHRPAYTKDAFADDFYSAFFFWFPAEPPHPAAWRFKFKNIDTSDLSDNVFSEPINDDSIQRALAIFINWLYDNLPSNDYTPSFQISTEMEQTMRKDILMYLTGKKSLDQTSETFSSILQALTKDAPDENGSGFRSKMEDYFETALRTYGENYRTRFQNHRRGSFHVGRKYISISGIFKKILTFRWKESSQKELLYHIVQSDFIRILLSNGLWFVIGAGIGGINLGVLMIFIIRMLRILYDMILINLESDLREGGQTLPYSPFAFGPSWIQNNSSWLDIQRSYYQLESLTIQNEPLTEVDKLNLYEQILNQDKSKRHVLRTIRQIRTVLINTPPTTSIRERWDRINDVLLRNHISSWHPGIIFTFTILKLPVTRPFPFQFQSQFLTIGAIHQLIKWFFIRFPVVAIRLIIKTAFLFLAGILATFNLYHTRVFFHRIDNFIGMSLGFAPTTSRLLRYRNRSKTQTHPFRLTLENPVSAEETNKEETEKEPPLPINHDEKKEKLLNKIEKLDIEGLQPLIDFVREKVNVRFEDFIDRSWYPWELRMINFKKLGNVKYGHFQYDLENNTLILSQSMPDFIQTLALLKLMPLAFNHKVIRGPKQNIHLPNPYLKDMTWRVYKKLFMDLWSNGEQQEDDGKDFLGKIGERIKNYIWMLTISFHAIMGRLNSQSKAPGIVYSFRYPLIISPAVKAIESFKIGLYLLMAGRFLGVTNQDAYPGTKKMNLEKPLSLWGFLQPILTNFGIALVYLTFFIALFGGFFLNLDLSFLMDGLIFIKNLLVQIDFLNIGPIIAAVWDGFASFFLAVRSLLEFFGITSFFSLIWSLLEPVRHFFTQYIIPFVYFVILPTFLFLWGMVYGYLIYDIHLGRYAWKNSAQITTRLVMISITPSIDAWARANEQDPHAIYESVERKVSNILSRVKYLLSTFYYSLFVASHLVGLLLYTLILALIAYPPLDLRTTFTLIQSFGFPVSPFLYVALTAITIGFPFSLYYSFSSLVLRLFGKEVGPLRIFVFGSILGVGSLAGLFLHSFFFYVTLLILAVGIVYGIGYFLFSLAGRFLRIKFTHPVKLFLSGALLVFLITVVSPISSSWIMSRNPFKSRWIANHNSWATVNVYNWMDTMTRPESENDRRWQLIIHGADDPDMEAGQAEITDKMAKGQSFLRDRLFGKKYEGMEHIVDPNTGKATISYVDWNVLNDEKVTPTQSWTKTYRRDIFAALKNKNPSIYWNPHFFQSLLHMNRSTAFTDFSASEWKLVINHMFDILDGKFDYGTFAANRRNQEAALNVIKYVMQYPIIRFPRSQPSQDHLTLSKRTRKRFQRKEFNSLTDLLISIEEAKNAFGSEFEGQVERSLRMQTRFGNHQMAPQGNRRRNLILQQKADRETYRKVKRRQPFSVAQHLSFSLSSGALGSLLFAGVFSPFMLNGHLIPFVILFGIGAVLGFVSLFSGISASIAVTTLIFSPSPKKPDQKIINLLQIWAENENAKIDWSRPPPRGWVAATNITDQSVRFAPWLIAESNHRFFNWIRGLLLRIVLAHEALRLKGKSTLFIFLTKPVQFLSLLKSPYETKLDQEADKAAQFFYHVYQGELDKALAFVDLTRKVRLKNYGQKRRIVHWIRLLDDSQRKNTFLKRIKRQLQARDLWDETAPLAWNASTNVGDTAFLWFDKTFYEENETPRQDIMRAMMKAGLDKDFVFFVPKNQAKPYQQLRKDLALLNITVIVYAEDQILAHHKTISSRQVQESFDVHLGNALFLIPNGWNVDNQGLREDEMPITRKFEDFLPAATKLNVNNMLDILKKIQIAA